MDLACLSWLGNEVFDNLKIGGTWTPTDAKIVVERIQQREPGKITLITRYGASKVGELLPKHIRAVEDSEYRRCIVWQCDPMHGNTLSTGTGIKTRRFNDIYKERDALPDRLQRDRQTCDGGNFTVVTV